MRIITPGRKPKKEIEQMCERCGCVFAYNKEDVKVDHQYNESYYWVKCPCCDKTIVVKCFDEY